MNIKNNAAYFNYEIIEKFIAGMVLTGTEIKSIRKGKISFNDTFCLLNNNEIYIRNLYIAPYELGTYANHNPTQERKLLLTKKEIKNIDKKNKEKGYTIIPLNVFINNKGLAKINIALAKGKKDYDKRETIKKRDAEREIRRFNNI